MAKTPGSPMLSGPSERESIDVRKIENGYVVRRSGEDAKGNYCSSEVYSPTKPEVVIAPAPASAATKGGRKAPNALLSAATSHLKRK